MDATAKQERRNEKFSFTNLFREDYFLKRKNFRISNTRERGFLSGEHKQKFFVHLLQIYVLSLYPSHNGFILLRLDQGQIWLRDYVSCVRTENVNKRKRNSRETLAHVRIENVLNKYLNDKLKLIYNYPSRFSEKIPLNFVEQRHTLSANLGSQLKSESFPAFVFSNRSVESFT